ncbi:hypothetical protein [Gluconobacter kondonii]|uniref:hypothetical protein n=1 Tax=Gluconobacter kondonii TaxID=941463 RepID=UPI001B8CBBA5|nr:hypothetical protein [Gluconobacter kondonii]MBS1081788.1 hypothetical protein [Gluconobacter kondonii]
MDKDASWKVGSIASAMPGVRNYTPAQACNPLSVLRRLWGEAECPVLGGKERNFTVQKKNEMRKTL